jgi:TolB-like protein
MDDVTPRLQRSLGDAFTIERELGGGGMARVFLARDQALDRQVVVKALDLEASAAASGERFRREVRMIAKLQHPHIVPMLTAGGDDSLLWYAMPYVAGESLRARLVREGALPLADALRIMRELLDALGFAHERGIVHRDVKPENILLEGKHAVVADFGVAKALADAGVSSGLTSAGMALGTPAYMAPEQAMGDATTNHRADLYAAGAVFYEMLVGAPLYSGNAQAVVAAHLTAPVPRVEDRRRDVPAAVAGLTSRLLAKSPAERPQSAHEALTVLDLVTTPGGTLAAATASTSSSGASPAHAAVGSPRRARNVAVLAGLLVLMLAGAGAWWRQRTPAGPVAEGADVIAVMPLGSTGDSALSRLGRDLVVTLSANLDGVGSLRAVDAMSVIMRAEQLPRPLGLADARALARELGARSVLHGSVVRDGALVRADIRLYAVDGDEVLARVVAHAASDSVRALTDSVTNDVLRQVWRRGTPPSPLLSEVTTSSNEALRAFLSGEAHFQRFAWDSALADYARAAAADSMFVQAYLRTDYVRSWSVVPADPVVRGRLLALMDRLPPRDRELLALRFTTGITTRQRIDSGRVLAARYPDYPTAQYAVADAIIHSGPVVGVPITEAIPFLDRLDVLAPAHADNAFHRMMVASALSDTGMLFTAATRLAANGSGLLADYGQGHTSAVQARRNGGAMAPLEAAAYVRSSANFARLNPALRWIPRDYYVPLAPPAFSDSLLTVVSRDGSFAGVEPSAINARGHLAISRGDFANGVALLASLETSRAPMAIRLGAARSAAIASWMGTLPVAAADSALAHARETLGPLAGLDAAELTWLGGVVGIAAGDSARVVNAAAAIADTGAVARRLPRSLHALWRERRTGETDSLRVLEDDAMARSVTFSSAMPLHRWAIGRALVRAGDPARAEHYLQWTDAVSTIARPAAMAVAFGSYNAYQRGLALEAAGDRARAIAQFEQFIDTVDKPPPSIKPQLDDAKARVAKLGGDARR